MQSQVTGRTPSCWAYDAQRELEMLIEVRGGAIRCFSAPQGPICFSPSVTLSLSLEDARHCSAPPPRAARRSIRLLCVLTVFLLTHTGSCLVAAVRRCKGGDGRGEKGRGGRLFEVTDIATTDDKMLMQEMLNNITWTSTGARQTDILLNFLAVCDSA